MAKFKGELSRTFTVAATKERAMEFMSDPEKFRHCLIGVEKAERLPDGTVKYQLEEKAEAGVRFKGAYSVKFVSQGDALTWTTVGQGNMWSNGKASFRAVGASTEITYQESLECDMDVNMLLGKVIAPIVNREIAKGVGGYLDRVKESLDKPA